MLNKHKYSADERIKLATIMRHSVQTGPSYLSMVVQNKVPMNAKQRKEVEKTTTRSTSNKESPKAAPKAPPKEAAKAKKRR